MGKFKKGLIIGGLLGAALTWLNVTPKGKELRDKILLHSDALYKELRESLKQLEGPTREMYDALVERAVAEYGQKKELASDMKTMVVKELKKRWEKIEKELDK